MTILKGDVKLVKSEVMDDVPEGGGGPTANEVVDGASNAAFPDVSEVDRAAGRVSARKVHVWVQSKDTETYLGGNVIVAEPPNDPNVSITLMSTGETFDRRTAAISRIEAYLSVGTDFAGFLFGNHITGQRTLSILQRTAETPAIGSSLALTKREGFSDQYVQYVRVTEASVTLRGFTDTGGEYTRYVLDLKISDPLRADFPGFDASRIDPGKAQLAAATKISEVIVADAAKYFGVVALDAGAAIGDYSVKGKSIFTQLVPSAQIETPIGDARTNQLLVGVVSGGAAVNTSVTLAFTTAQSLFIGGAIRPNTLSITNGGVTAMDSGGRLMAAGTQIGNVDYENGILSLLTNAFGTGALTFAVTYQPAQVPEAVTQSQGFPVTIATRSLSYVRTIEPAPVPGTLSIAYMVASRWYVLRDDGSGAIRGSESGYGSGTLNPTTGTISVTLGALPDVGSEVIYQWVEPLAARDADVLKLDNDGKLYWPFNTSGESSLEPGTKSITPGALSIAWNDGSPRAATDNGAGSITGDATGTVNYARGVFRLTPNLLPAPGTTFVVNTDVDIRTSASATLVGGVGNLGATNIKPGSISLNLTAQIKGKYATSNVIDWGPPRSFLVDDDGAGVLRLYPAGYMFSAEPGRGPVAIGTVDYTTGAIALASTVALSSVAVEAIAAYDNVYLLKTASVMQVYQNLS